MTSSFDSICPLCSTIYPQETLHESIAAEHSKIRQSTIKVIQAYHPGWKEGHGACPPCWSSYRDAGRILNVLKASKPINALSLWNES
jgi:hypothetical protein